MFSLKINSDKAERLHAFLARGGNAVRSNHWQHFGARNRVSVERQTGIVTASGGAGFDGSYEQNFRAATARERLGLLWRTLRGTNEERRHVAAFRAAWPDAEARLAAGRRVLGGRMTPQKVLACHYLALMEPFLLRARPRAYLEIGAGSGYLAALIHATCGARVAILDLPEILPFSFLYLDARFPGADLRFGAEPQATFRFLVEADAQLLPDGEFDLAVNTASFGEMVPAQVAAYFALLRRVMAKGGRFFTVNRAEKWMNEQGRPLEDNRAGKGLAMRFDEYPWSAADRILLDGLSEVHARVQPESPMKVRLCELAPRP